MRKAGTADSFRTAVRAGFRSEAACRRPRLQLRQSYGCAADGNGYCVRLVERGKVSKVRRGRWGENRHSDVWMVLHAVRV